jgi:hypothetical protein
LSPEASEHNEDAGDKAAKEARAEASISFFRRCFVFNFF